MQAPLRARFRDMSTVDMKEILQQWMFEDNSYKAHEAHNDLYEALQKSLELDYSNQRLADQEEARKKKRKKRAAPRTPFGSPPSPPPPPPPPAGASGAPGTSGASGSSQLPPPPPPPSTGASGSDQLQGSKAPSSSKPAASTHQSMAWTTSDTRFESTVHLSDDEDSENDHQPKADSRKDWWKPLPEEERPATPEPAWTIPSSNKSDVVNNWASALATTYEPPAENSLLAKIRDMTTFMNWYCQKMSFTFSSRWRTVTRCSQLRLTGRIQKEIMSESMSTDLEYLRYGSKGSNLALSISKMKAASYPDFRLKLLKLYIDRHDSPSRRKDVRTHMRILSVVRIKAYSRYGYDFLSEIILRRANFQEYTIAVKDFKNLYPSDFEDLNLLLLQGHLDHLHGSDKRIYQIQLNLTKPGWDATCYEFKHDYTIIESPRAVVFPIDNNDRKIMRFNKIYKFSDGTLTRILEALDYRIKEFKVKRLNLVKILRVLRIILEVLPEHPSDTKVLTMKMEILLEPTSNKLLWIFNSLVHSLRALSTLRRSGLRTASAAAKPCQGDSSEFYLITGRISDGSSCWQETCQFTTPCSHLTFLIKDIMITERLTTQLPQL
ncbi:hypothetical protein Tco_0439197 [Tanacetum coccineum]